MARTAPQLVHAARTAQPLHLTRSTATLSLTLLAEGVLVMDPTGRREQPRSGPPASTILRQSGAADPWLVERSRRANAD